MKISQKAREKFEYFLSYNDRSSLSVIEECPTGQTALECFHIMESTGVNASCKEPVILQQALNGKWRHGVTVDMLAEDYIGRILFSSDLAQYPEWIRKEVLAAAAKKAQKTLGFVPEFIRTGDFSIT